MRSESLWYWPHDPGLPSWVYQVPLPLNEDTWARLLPVAGGGDDFLTHFEPDFE
jgi:hypothetical protein